MMSAEPSSIPGPEDRLGVTRRVEFRFPLGQTLPKLEELSALASPMDVRLVERDRRDPVRRLELDFIGRLADVAGVVRTVERHLAAQVMRDEVLPAPGARKDPPYPDPESARRIAAPMASGPLHAPTTTTKPAGKPVIVAIIDSGIMAAHPDLEEHLWSGPGDPPAHGRSFIESAPSTEDQEGHGTMLAGTVLAGAAAAAAVRLMAIKFFDARTPPEANRGADAISWALEQHADIINLSWAVGVEKPRLRDAVAYAGEKGVLVVVAAGNSGADNDALSTFPASYGRSMEHVITVMATDDLDDRPGFSNYGAKSVHIAAPGMRIMSTHPYRNMAPKPEHWERYQRYDGTSAAAAYVAGAAALLKSVCPGLSPKQLKAFLIDNADPPRDPRGGGKPRLNVGQALTAVRADCNKVTGAAGGLLAAASPEAQPA